MAGTDMAAGSKFSPNWDTACRLTASSRNLVPRAHVSFSQCQDTTLCNYQFPESEILGVPVSQCMRALGCMASKEKVDVDAFYKGIQYALDWKNSSIKF